MRTSITLLTGLALVAPLSAQSRDDICASFGTVTVGQWAEYTMQSPQMGGSMSMRLAIVGSEPRDGSEHYWFEMKMATPQGAMAMQFLVPRFPYQPDEVKRAVMKMGPAPAMELNEQMLAMMQQQSGGDLSAPILEACESAAEVGWESITVPAGTFRALHVTATMPEGVGNAWLLPDMPFGMIKMDAPGGEAVTLVGHGNDATSSIPDRPGAPR